MTQQSVSLPPISQPFVDPQGKIILAWWQALFGFYQRTGGQQGVDITIVNEKANEALDVAVVANTTSTKALTQATTAQNAASTALSLATTNSGLISSISGGIANALLRNNNLIDVASASQARINLGLGTIQVSTFYDGHPSASQIKIIPLTRSISIPANFGGTAVWASTVPLADAVFTIKLIRSGASSTIGTITIVHGSNTATMACSPVSASAGDVIEIDAPSSPDANMANVGISILLNI